MRVTSITGWTLDSSIAPCTIPGDGDRRCRSVRDEIGAALGPHPHRVVWLHDADLADLAVFGGNRTVAGDGYLGIGRRDLDRLAVDVQHRLPLLSASVPSGIGPNRPSRVSRGPFLVLTVK